MISFPRLFKQQINDIEKAKEHSINGAFLNSKSVKPLRRKMIHCFEALQSDCVSRIIWFRLGLQSKYRKSFDLERDVEQVGGCFYPTGDKKLFSRGRDA